MVMTPYAAFQKELHGQTEEVYLEEMVGRVNANMILPYPPGVPLVMPGEMITEESRPVLEFLQMLCEIGAHYPGFETDIHGAYRQADGRYTVKVLKEETTSNDAPGKWLATSFFTLQGEHMKTPSQPRAIYYIVAIQIWEYFSFYGMRALLILYLTHQLGFDDSHAISLFSAYASLVYVTPILGGWLADRLLGNRTAVIAGALLMTLGHVVLGVESTSAWSLYVALAIIICGYGLFKSNISCLLGELYAVDDHRRDGGFSLLYAAGNVGSIAAPIACGLAAQWYGWHIGFALAGIGMFIGLMIFLSGSRHFRHTRGVDKPALRAVKFVLPTWGWLLVMLPGAGVLHAAAAKQLVRLSAGDRLRVRRPDGGADHDQSARASSRAVADRPADARDAVLGAGAAGRELD
jgi:hypothetical protein